MQDSEIPNPPNPPFELDLSGWDYSLDAFDMTMTDMSFPDSNAPPMPQNNMLLTDEISLPTPPTEDSTLASFIIPPVTPPPSPYTQLVAGILSEYPLLLMKGSFLSPVLHLEMYSLYSNVVPDMSRLRETSMAICCGGGLQSPDTNRFYSRAMEAAKERLIGSFVGISLHV